MAVILPPAQIETTEHLLGVVQVALRAPRLIELPTTPGNPIPAPTAVSGRQGELPVTDSPVRFEMFANGAWRDISGLVVSAEWHHGSQLPNRIGGVLDVAGGVLLLDNTDGWFNPLNPHPHVDPNPGVPIRITERGHTLFIGYSEGALDQSGATEVYVATMPIYGVLQRLERYSDGFFALAGEGLTPAQVFQLVLNAVEYSGLVDIQPGSVELYGTRLNRSGILGQGRRRVSFLAACNSLAVLEGGRIYDSRLGIPTFANYGSRSVTPAHSKVKRVQSPRLVRNLNADRTVVNLIEHRSGSFNAQGTNILEFQETLPITLEIPANTDSYGIELSIANSDTDFVGDWAPLIRGTHYDWSLSTLRGSPAHPVFVGGETGCVIYFPNPTNTAQTATVYRVDGNIFKASYTSRLSLRSGPSIAAYGTHGIEYPSDLVTNQDLAYSRAVHWLQEYDGLASDGSRSPIWALEVTVREWEGAPFDVDDLVLLDWETPYGANCLDWPFWVDRVSHTVESENGAHDVKLTLVDAWRKGRTLNEQLLGRIDTDSTAGEHFLGQIRYYNPTETLLGTIYVENLLGTIPLEVHLGRVGVEIQLGHVPVEVKLGHIPIEVKLGRVSVHAEVVKLYPEWQLGHTIQVEQLLGSIDSLYQEEIRLYPEWQLGRTMYVEQRIGSIASLYQEEIRLYPEQAIGSITGIKPPIVEKLLGKISI